MKIITQEEFAKQFNDQPVYLYFKDNTLYLTADNTHCMSINQAVKKSVSEILLSAVNDSVLNKENYQTKSGASRSQDYL